MDVEEATLRMYVEGQRRFPSVELDLESFRRHCERVLGNRPSLDAERHGAELYLCCACAASNRRAAEILESEGSAVARAAIARVHREPEFIRDTLQDLWNKLLVGPEPKVRDYSGRGSLHAWLGVTAARAAFDRLRSLRSGRRADLADSLIDPILSPEAQLTRVRYRAEFQRALSSAVERLTERDRNVLRMHALGGCSIDQIGRAYRVHRATAARWLDRIRMSILESVREELSSTAGLTDGEFASIAESIASQLELGLSSLSKEVFVTEERHG